MYVPLKLGIESTTTAGLGSPQVAGSESKPLMSVLPEAPPAAVLAAPAARAAPAAPAAQVPPPPALLPEDRAARLETLDRHAAGLIPDGDAHEVRGRLYYFFTAPQEPGNPLVQRYLRDDGEQGDVTEIPGEDWV